MENGLINANSHLSANSTQAGKSVTPQTKAKQSFGGVSPAGHKRSLSGSILSLPFFGGSQSRQDVKSPSRTKSAAADPPSSPPAAGGAMASAVTQQKKARKRKGSLRKTALLGPGKVRLEREDEEAVTSAETDNISPATKEKIFQPSSNGHAIPLSFRTTRILSEALPKSDNLVTEPPFTHVPSTHLNSASTTDEDDLPPLASSLKPTTLHPQESYFPTHPRSYRPRPPSTSKSPLGSLPASIPSSPQEWDYSETRAWGWVLLITTWIVFVVGMGSCFGVWSWAWDVGETPYAPPELEDDPTLPIVGYYPALIILTGVMAWVWVVVAWVGMKYFRHAKMNGEEE